MFERLDLTAAGIGLWLIAGIAVQTIASLPPGLTGLAGDLLNDPPGFDRGVLPAVDRRIAAFFVRHLVGSLTAPAASALLHRPN